MLTHAYTISIPIVCMWHTVNRYFLFIRLDICSKNKVSLFADICTSSAVEERSFFVYFVCCTDSSFLTLPIEFLVFVVVLYTVQYIQ